MIRTLATIAWWHAVLGNLLVCALAAWQGQYAAAVLSAFLLVVLTAWRQCAPRLDALLDAQLAEAIARQHIHQAALVTVLESQRRGRSGVRVVDGGIVVQ